MLLPSAMCSRREKTLTDSGASIATLVDVENDGRGDHEQVEGSSIKNTSDSPVYGVTDLPRGAQAAPKSVEEESNYAADEAPTPTPRAETQLALTPIATSACGSSR
jgi:hypothetical protein